MAAFIAFWIVDFNFSSSNTSSALSVTPPGEVTFFRRVSGLSELCFANSAEPIKDLLNWEINSV